VPSFGGVQIYRYYPLNKILKAIFLIGDGVVPVQVKNLPSNFLILPEPKLIYVENDLDGKLFNKFAF
jgi:hypothetical protein